MRYSHRPDGVLQMDIVAGFPLADGTIVEALTRLSS
jgi:hypothetical protein